MAKTIKQLGIKEYLDQVYKAEGGYDRFAKIVQLKWPQQEIAAEFGVSRETIRQWVTMIPATINEEIK
jgi:transcriptional regulator with XRE-family HTH domain